MDTVLAFALTHACTSYMQQHQCAKHDAPATPFDITVAMCYMSFKHGLHDRKCHNT